MQLYILLAMARASVSWSFYWISPIAMILVYLGYGTKYSVVY